MENEQRRVFHFQGALGDRQTSRGLRKTRLFYFFSFYFLFLYHNFLSKILLQNANHERDIPYATKKEIKPQRSCQHTNASTFDILPFVTVKYMKILVSNLNEFRDTIPIYVQGRDKPLKTFAMFVFNNFYLSCLLIIKYACVLCTHILSVICLVHIQFHYHFFFRNRSLFADTKSTSKICKGSFNSDGTDIKAVVMVVVVILVVIIVVVAGTAELSACIYVTLTLME